MKIKNLLSGILLISLCINPGISALGENVKNDVETLKASKVEKPTALTIAPFSIKAGEEKIVEVLMDNPTVSITGIQFDLYMPEGISVAQNRRGAYMIALGSRTDDFSHNRPSAKIQSDGALRVICYSPENWEFLGTEGDVLVLTVKASETLKDGIYELGIKKTVLGSPDAVTKIEPADYKASIVAGGIKDRNLTFCGNFTAEALSEFSTLLKPLTDINTIDLTGAFAVEATSTLTTGNPNTLIFLKEGAALANDNNVVVGSKCAKFVLNDSHSFFNTKDFTADVMTYNRSIIIPETEKNFVSTLILPAELPLNSINGTIYYLDSFHENYLNFISEKSNTLQANIPYLVSISENKELLTETLNVVVKATPKEMSVTKGNLTLLGTYDNKDLKTVSPDYYYYQLNNDFNRSEIVTLNSFRAALKYNGENGIEKYTILYDGVTSVESITVDNLFPATIYDLNGRLIKENAENFDGIVPGIYIVNGEKVVIK